MAQFRYVENFVKRYPSHFALAKTPKLARKYIAQGKKVFIHALEVAGGLIQAPDDAKFWANQGVALINPIHLVDNEYGASRLAPGLQSILNPRGFFARKIFRHKDKGLTTRGRKVVRWLIQNGILVDVDHMSKNSLKDAINVLNQLNAPAIAGHARAAKLDPSSSGLTDHEILQIYQTGGFVALTTGNHSGLNTYAQSLWQGEQDYCPGSVDDYILQIKYFQQLLEHQLSSHYSLAMSTDFNGMVDHFRPKYGAQGCFLKNARTGSYHPQINRTLNEFDIKGLNHVGQLPLMYKILGQQDVNLSQQYSSAEAFLQAWEKVRSLRKYERL